ncbi:STT3 domain-containing protein [candidate division CSSED10-310 bacterium]|uniref:STT3 domain-containing protein n=1 Tax=candidate division CSSED10-310 bacterium TaxID=2855610 RepID=A0ABV6YSP3_UNCC1
MIKPKSGTFQVCIFLLLLLSCGVIVRLHSFRSVFGSDGIYFYGQDTYYHVRRVLLMVSQYPHLHRLDHYSAFPWGLHDPWPPAYDFFIASVAKLMGAEADNVTMIETICALAPVFFGVLTLVIYFVLIKRLTDMRVAFFSTAILVFLPKHVNVTLLGRPDHHAVEPLLFVLISYIMVWWYSKLQGYDDSTIRFWPYLKVIILPMLLLSLAVGLSFLTWMGSAIFIGFFCLFFVFQSVSDIRNNSFILDWWVYLAFSFFLACLCMLPFYATTIWSKQNKLYPYYPTYFQIIVMLLAFLFVLYLSLISYYAMRRNNNWSLAIFFHSLFGFLGAGILRILAPKFYENIVLGFFLLSQEDVWLSHTSESQPLFFFRGILSARYALDNFGYGIFILPVLLFISILGRWRSRRRMDFNLNFILFWGLYFSIMGLFSRRYSHFLSLSFAFFLADTCLFLSKRLKLKTLVKGNARFIEAGVAIILIIIMLIPPFQSYVHMIAQDFKISIPGPRGFEIQMCSWIKKNTPPQKGYLDTSEAPDYGILAPNMYGHWLVYYSRRPVHFSPFAVHFKSAARLFLLEDVERFSTYCESHRLKYVLLEPVAFMIPQYAQILNKPQIYQQEKIVTLPGGEMLMSVNMTTNYYRLVTSRLFELDGNCPQGNEYSDLKPIQHFRLIRDGEPIYDHGSRQLIVPLKLFEWVPGARVTGQGEPESTVAIELSLRTNVGRQFRYRVEGKISKQGNYQFRIPYSTQESSTSAVTAQGPYKVSLNGNLVAYFEVLEEDVQNNNHLYLLPAEGQLEKKAE